MTPSTHPSPSRKTPRRWLPWLGAATLLALLAAGLRPQPVPVEIGRASEGTLRTSVNEEGRTRIRHRYTVHAPVAGHLRRIPFKAGEPVRAGETVVATLDPLPSALLDPRSRSLAEARRDSAAAQLAKARDALRFASLELQRFQKLFADQTVSAQELEGVQWREAAAARETAAAESALRQAEAELAVFAPPLPSSPDSPVSPVHLLAPASGRILHVHEENARAVAPGTPLLTVGDPADLEVVIEVLSRDAATIRPGAPVEFDQWGGPSPLLGSVRHVEPAAFTKVSALGVEEQRVNVVADLTSPQDQRPGLGDGFRVEARIIVWQADRTIKVPIGGLFRKGDGWAAFTLRNGRTVLTPVQPGRSSDSEIQILDGLAPNQEIVLYPGDRIRENVRVRPVTIAP